MKKQEKWDIFCKVVDNFGDIGICWRLASQLHHQYNVQLRLFIDDLPSAAKLLVGMIDRDEQLFEGVTLIRWNENTAFDYAANVVVETFACHLPLAYLTLMAKNTIWVNVDHLSAESWVAEFHGLNGKHHESKLIRHFYFPGFNDKTGGLLREQDLIIQRDAFQASVAIQQDFWQSLEASSASDLTISLFHYHNAPVDALLQSLADGEGSVTVYMPFNHNMPPTILGYANLVIGDCLTIGALTLHILPFLSQADYDRLLWACDINFVRGEDSWVRAIWAGKPFIWQPYWQEDNAHLLKLNAFLTHFYQHAELYPTVVQVHEAWSTQTFHHAAWQQYVTKLTVIAAHTHQQSQRIIQQQDLASKLLAFCADLAN